MKKNTLLFLTFILFISSCFYKLNERTNYEIIGKVMMYEVFFPMKSKIIVFQNNIKLAETNSNKKGEYRLVLPKFNVKKELTFVLEHKSIDTIYNVNGYDKILYSCQKNDTIITIFESNLILTVNNCELNLIDFEEKTHH